MQKRDENVKAGKQGQASSSSSSTVFKTRNKQFIRTNADCEDIYYDPCCDPPPPFCSTVKNLSGPPRKGNIHSSYPEMECGGGPPPTGRVKTSIKWDYDAGVKIPTKKVEYGEELYEKAVQNLVKQLALEKSGKKSKSKSSLETIAQTKEDKCKDYSKPAFNSSKRMTEELAKALEQLKQLPLEMERIFMTDQRFEPIVLEKVKFHFKNIYISNHLILIFDFLSRPKNH
jgi:hypothetical protein